MKVKDTEEDLSWALDILIGIAICRYRPGLTCGSCPRFRGWHGRFPDCEDLSKQQVQDAIIALRPGLKEYAETNMKEEW